MNKILNWTFGACFRTLGRILAIFLVGALLVFIGLKLDIELPSWLALNIKADVVNGWASGLPTLSRVDYRSCNSTNCSTDISIDTAWLENNNEVRSYVGNSTGITIGSNGYVVMVPYYTNKDYLYEVNYYVCSNKNLQTSDYNFEISAVGFSSGLSLEHNYKLVARSGLSNVPLIDELGGTSFYQCNLFTGLISAKYDSAWLGFRIINTQSNVSGSWIGTIAVEVNQLGLWDGTLSNVIENSGFAKAESVDQVQQSVTKVQQEIQQTQDTITNEDTQGAESSASDFFNDFTTETFGLTSIITAPLNAINSLLNTSCSPLVLPIPFVNKNLSLPCMSSIYNEFFGGFFNLYQIITTGLICYYIIVRIFNLVKDFKNPEHDEIEVMDL